MKFCVFVLMSIFVCIGVFAQDKSVIDSVRVANKKIADSIKQANIARTDSLKKLAAERKIVREAQKKQISSNKKVNNNQAALETFDQEEKKDSASISRLLRLDSLRQIREIENEHKKRALAEQKTAITANRKNILKPITQEMILGYRLCSDGWSIFVQRGFIRTNAERPHTNFLWIDISEKKHPKETKSLNENFSVVNPSEIKPISYKYGKINNFYQFKIGYGNMIPITGRLDKKSIVINWVYAAAFSLGMIKPYYLDLLVPEGNFFIRKFDRYTDENAPYFLDLNNQGTIVGGASFTKGLNQMKFQPGLALRSGFYFDYAATRKSLLGVELGASAELYTKKIPIMATAKNNAIFFNFYADFRIGKRWE